MQKVSSTTTTRHLELHLPTTRERERERKSNARGGRISTQGEERGYRERGTETKCYIIRETEIESADNEETDEKARDIESETQNVNWQ